MHASGSSRSRSTTPSSHSSAPPVLAESAAPEETRGHELVVTHVQKRFRGLLAVDDVSLRLRQGEIVGLIGPNGSGKTTLLNVASGVTRPTRGKVTVGGTSAQGKRPHVFASLGVRSEEHT